MKKIPEQFLLNALKGSLLVIILAFIFSGCKKYLDEKSNQKLVVPSTVQDLQALLDRYTSINQMDPGVIEESADDYYLTNTSWQSSPEQQKRIYIWESDSLFRMGGFSNDWVNCYRNIYTANVVLDNIDKINRTPGDEVQWNNAKGHALFVRGRQYLLAAWIWTLAYDPNTANNDLGLPLRLDPNFNKPSIRSSVQQTYDQIIQDIKSSVPLLPDIPVHVMRPSKPAAWALLARVYLSMRKYDSCLKYSNLCLQMKSDLMDYNDPQFQMTYPFSPYNKEVIYEGVIPYPPNISNGNIDSTLYRSYNANDKRTTLFFNTSGIGPSVFRGNYEGNNNLFDGIATDEVFLMRSESYARTGNIAAAMNDLNALLIKRWKTGFFVPFTATDMADALTKILTERRKELIFRGLRWMDLKRLNKEGANITLKRFLNNQFYTLPPNDLRYALPIPEDVIAISGMPQNPR